MKTDFSVEVLCDDTIDHIRFKGMIDAKAEELISELPGRVNGPVVRCDFSGAGRINSMGIAFILRFFKTLRDEKNARITVYGLNQINSILFKMTGIFLLANHEQ